MVKPAQASLRVSVNDLLHSKNNIFRDLEKNSVANARHLLLEEINYCQRVFKRAKGCIFNQNKRNKLIA